VRPSTRARAPAHPSSPRSSYRTALAAFGFAGASNAPFFRATLAARSRYSPERARAQVFVSLAGMTVAVA